MVPRPYTENAAFIRVRKSLNACWMGFNGLPDADLSKARLLESAAGDGAFVSTVSRLLSVNAALKEPYHCGNTDRSNSRI